MRQYWPLCSQLLPIGAKKALVYTDYESSTWTGRMDYVMKNDQLETAVKIRWRASKHNGRSYATPTATSQALAASRRRGTGKTTSLHHQADVEIKGEVGRADGQVISLLMRHVVQCTGLQLRETSYQGPMQLGEFVHLASLDPDAPPGKVKVILASAQEVRRIYNALHGQTIMIGQDRIGIVVGNDLVEGQRVPGNDLRSWM